MFFEQVRPDIHQTLEVRFLSGGGTPPPSLKLKEFGMTSSSPIKEQAYVTYQSRAIVSITTTQAWLNICFPYLSLISVPFLAFFAHLLRLTLNLALG